MVWYVEVARTTSLLPPRRLGCGERREHEKSILGRAGDAGSVALSEKVSCEHQKLGKQPPEFASTTVACCHSLQQVDFYHQLTFQACNEILAEISRIV